MRATGVAPGRAVSGIAAGSFPGLPETADATPRFVRPSVRARPGCLARSRARVRAAVCDDLMSGVGWEQLSLSLPPRHRVRLESARERGRWWDGRFSIRAVSCSNRSRNDRGTLDAGAGPEIFSQSKTSMTRGTPFAVPVGPALLASACCLMTVSSVGRWRRDLDGERRFHVRVVRHVAPFIPSVRSTAYPRAAMVASAQARSWRFPSSPREASTARAT